MTSVAGHARPSLSKPADQITLLDIYKAVEGEKPLLHLDTHTNPDCGVGINIQLSLQGFYDEIQKTAEEKMNTITLQDIIDTYYQRTSELTVFAQEHNFSKHLLIPDDGQGYSL